MPDTENIFKRVSPLAGVAVTGQYGSGRKKGVSITLCPPGSVVLVAARNGKTTALSALMKKHFSLAVPKQGCSERHNDRAMHWAGPGQWYLTSPDNLHEALAKKLSGIASVVDQSHGRVTIAIAGPNARDVLAKGTPVDLHPDVFKPGNCALTEMAHTAVHLVQTRENEYQLSLYRGFAESFWEWLCEMSMEFGYEVL